MRGLQVLRASQKLSSLVDSKEWPQEQPSRSGLARDRRASRPGCTLKEAPTCRAGLLHGPGSECLIKFSSTKLTFLFLTLILPPSPPGLLTLGFPFLSLFSALLAFA